MTLRLCISVCNTWSVCGMMRKGGNINIWGIIYQATALCTASPTWTCLGLNPGLHGERRAPNRRRHHTVANFLFYFLWIPKIRGLILWRSTASYMHTLISKVYIPRLYSTFQGQHCFFYKQLASRERRGAAEIVRIISRTQRDSLLQMN